jgi:DNA-binding transcriptional ArsR family regulator
MIDQPAQGGGTFFTAPVCDRDHTHRILRSVVCTHHRSTDFPPTSLFPGQVIWPSGHGGTCAHQIDAPAPVKEARHMARLPDIESEQSKVTTVLRAMSNAKRMRILNALSDGRERSVSELEGVIASLSQSALSQHLARLRRANIVRTRRESQTIYYSIDDADVLRILRLLSHIYNDDPVMKRTTH